MIRGNRFREIARFIRGIFCEKGNIPLHAPVFLGKEKEYLAECVDTTMVSSVGAFVPRFEESVKKFVGVEHAIATVNGTAALHVALLLTGVAPGDHVIMSPLTFVATGNAVAYTGASPLFLDCDRDTLGLCPQSLNDFLDGHTVRDKDGSCLNKHTNRRIGGCIPVHVFGQPAGIADIVSVCTGHGIPVIEDAAESLGSYVKGKHTGTFGRIGILSFNGNKVITTGGGGMLLTKEADLADRARHITTTAKVPHPYEFYHDQLAFNYRMPAINAALGVGQMENLPKFLEAKRELAKEYRTFFLNTGIEFLDERPPSHSNYWLNCIFLKNRDERDSFLTTTNSLGVMTRPAWTLLSDLPMFKDCFCGPLQNARARAETAVNIPSSVRSKSLKK